MPSGIDALSRAELRRAARGLSPAEREIVLRERCRTDVGLFCLAYFPERFTLPFNRMHRDLLGRRKTPWREREAERWGPQRIADAAPRGGAKSTIVTFADLVHDVVYGFEAYIGILSTDYSLAEDLVKTLHGVFTTVERAPRLHEHFGPFAVKGTQTSFVVHVQGGDPRGTKVKAFSIGGTIRGVQHDGIRPTKVVMDDCDHPQRVRSPDQRNKNWAFLAKDVLKCGLRGGNGATVFHMVGTVLHPDSLLARAMQSPGWRATKWKSVIEWPERMDLWATCRQVWSDLTDPDREGNARRFYERHREDMDRGAKVLWPDGESIFELMLLRWSDGEAAFNSEKQNEPVDPERQVFDVPAFRRCRFDGEAITSAEGRKVRLNACKVAVWLDPRASDEVKRNDFAALALVARDPVGYRYVLRCSMVRDSAAQARARYWSTFDQLGHVGVVYGYEDNGFAALNDEGFEREKQQRKDQRKPWMLNVVGYNSHSNKHDRIGRLQPDISNGWLQFADDLPMEVLDQFRDFPTGNHDDGPDAIERADWLLGEHMPTLPLPELS